MGFTFPDDKPTIKYLPNPVLLGDFKSSFKNNKGHAQLYASITYLMFLLSLC
jgi:hypothetical protein